MTDASNRRAQSAPAPTVPWRVDAYHSDGRFSHACHCCPRAEAVLQAERLNARERTDAELAGMKPYWIFRAREQGEQLTPDEVLAANRLAPAEEMLERIDFLLNAAGVPGEIYANGGNIADGVAWALGRMRVLEDAEREVQKATEYRERNCLPLSAAQITSQGNGWLLFCMKIEGKDRWFLYRPARYGARDLDGAPLLVQVVTQ